MKKVIELKRAMEILAQKRIVQLSAQDNNYLTLRLEDGNEITFNAEKTGCNIAIEHEYDQFKISPNYDAYLQDNSFNRRKLDFIKHASIPLLVDALNDQRNNLNRNSFDKQMTAPEIAVYRAEQLWRELQKKSSEIMMEEKQKQ